MDDIKHKRPQWYDKYHAWKYTAPLHWLVLFFSVFLLFVSFTNILLSFSPTVTTTITQTILPVNIGLLLPSNIFFTPILSNVDHQQTTTARLAGLTISDRRQDEPIGWSVTASCTNFFAINAPVRQAGHNNTISSGGMYTDAQGGTYRIIISQGGDLHTAKFVVIGKESAREQSLGTNVAIGTKGVTATFAPANYEAGDSWDIRVDTIPINNLTIIPEGLTSSVSTNSGVSLGSPHTLTNENDMATIMLKSATHAYGDFSTDLLFSLVVPPFTYANNYTAILTVTAD